MNEREETGPAPSDTTDFRPRAPAPPGPEKIGRYHIRRELGQGAFGVVYLAHDPVLVREVALKVPKFTETAGPLHDRFLREARAAAGLKHPNIVTVYDCDAEAGRHFIAMELVEGAPLSLRLTEGRPSYRQAAQWTRDVALALHHAHEQQVLHRDVKPGNILIDKQSRALLTDFGLAKFNTELVLVPEGDAEGEAQLTRLGTIVGTPAYMSPEQARGEVDTVGPASDQYSLGAVLYEMITGRHVFTGSARQMIEQAADPAREAPPPRRLQADVPLELQSIALKALKKHPLERYESLAALALDLHCWLKGDAIKAPLVSNGPLCRVCPGCDRRNAPTREACNWCNHSLKEAPLDEVNALLKEDERGKKKRRGRDRATGAALLPSARSLTAARWGLALHVARLVFLLLAAVLTAVVLVGAAMLGQPVTSPSPAHAWVRLGVSAVTVCAALQPVLGILGSVLCLRLPAGGVARALLIASLVLDAGAVFVEVGLASTDLGPRVSEWLAPTVELPGVLGGAISLLAWLLFMNYLIRVARFLHDRDAAHEAVLVIRWGLALAIIPTLLLTLSAFFLGDNPPCVVSCVVLVCLLLSVRWLLAYVGLLGTLREDLDRPMRETD